MNWIFIPKKGLWMSCMIFYCVMNGLIFSNAFLTDHK